MDGTSIGHGSRKTNVGCRTGRRAQSWTWADTLLRHDPGLTRYTDRVRHEELAEKECAIARTWAVIGERWTRMILRECFRGVRRFEDIQAKLQLGRNILTDRLQLLVHEGVLERRPYQERPTRYEYVLTQKARICTRWCWPCC